MVQTPKEFGLLDLQSSQLCYEVLDDLLVAHICTAQFPKALEQLGLLFLCSFDEMLDSYIVEPSTFLGSDQFSSI